MIVQTKWFCAETKELKINKG